MFKYITNIAAVTLFMIYAAFTFNAYAYKFHTKAAQAIVIEHNSNTVLFAHNATMMMAPSSMSKLMTLYVVFSYIKSGMIKMNDKFRVSKEAWQKGGSSMFLREGQLVTVRDLIHGIITVSGNDACITISEGIAGSQENFVKEMNETAKKLGLTNSNFVNATGWPDPKHLMTAKDLVTLAQRIFTDFPEYYYLFSEKEFTYNNIHQHNKNTLLKAGIGVDGMKTGHTNSGKYGIVVSAEQNGRRLFIIVNGLATELEREAEVKRLIQYSFNNFDSRTIIKRDTKIEEVKVWYGKEKTVPISIKDDLIISYPKGLYDQIKITVSYDDIVPSPIKKGQQLGELHVKIPGMEDRVIPVYAMKSVRQLNYLERLWRMIF